MSLVFVTCCVLSGLWDEMISDSDSQEFCRLYLIVCDLEISTKKGPRPERDDELEKRNILRTYVIIFLRVNS